MRKAPPRINLINIRPPYLGYNYFEGSKIHPFQHDTDQFEMVNAWWLAEAATLVYAEPDFVASKFAAAGLPHVTFFDGVSTQCFVAHNEHFVIVAFRGTELRRRTASHDFRNIIVDIVTDLRFTPIESGQTGRAHRGFKMALDEVWDLQGFKNHLDKVTTLENHKRRPVWFTGHSLGAALATLAAYRYSAQSGKVQGLYTFGSPRVGNRDFKEDFSQKEFYQNTYRFVNNNDIVTTVPPPGLYHHVGFLKYIDSAGQIHDNPISWHKMKDMLRGRLRHKFNDMKYLRSSLIPDDLFDHVPTLYATHIWNGSVAKT